MCGWQFSSIRRHLSGVGAWLLWVLQWEEGAPCVPIDCIASLWGGDEPTQWGKKGRGQKDGVKKERENALWGLFALGFGHREVKQKIL